MSETFRVERMKFFFAPLLVISLFSSLGTVERTFGMEGCTAAPVALEQVLADADALIAGRSGFSKVRVEGRSMLPFFGDGAVLVIKTMTSDKLKAGMVVVYRNRFGDMVAHRTLMATANGWTAHGYNNDEADSTIVNADNLIGVVYATLHSDGAQATVHNRRGANLDATPVALAASVR